MWCLAQARDHWPEITQSPRWPPQPSMEASVTIVIVGSGLRNGRPTVRLARDAHHSSSLSDSWSGYIRRYGLSETCVHWLWSISWIRRVCVTAMGTNSRRLDRCPKSFCQVFAGWGLRARSEDASRDALTTLFSLGKTSMLMRSRVDPRNAGNCVGINWDFPSFTRKPSFVTQNSVRSRWRSTSDLDWFFRSQSSRYWCMSTPCILRNASMTRTILVNTRGAVESPNGSTRNSYALPL